MISQEKVSLDSKAIGAALYGNSCRYKELLLKNVFSYPLHLTSFHLSISNYIYRSLFTLFLPLSISVPVTASFSLSLTQSIYLSIYWSIYLSICLSVSILTTWYFPAFSNLSFIIFFLAPLYYFPPSFFLSNLSLPSLSSLLLISSHLLWFPFTLFHFHLLGLHSMSSDVPQVRALLSALAGCIFISEVRSKQSYM